jgi:hypothetical protein
MQGMTIQEIMKELNVLKSVIPREAPWMIDMNVADYWLSALKPYNKIEVSAAFRMAAERCERFPSLAIFLQFINSRTIQSLPEGKAARIEIATKGHKTCKGCLNTGRVSARKKGAPAYMSPYAFRCPYCSVADTLNLSRTMPTWCEMYAMDFDAL